MSWSSSSFISTRLTLIRQVVVSTPLIRGVEEPTPGEGFLRSRLTVVSFGLKLTRRSRLSERVLTAHRSSPHCVAPLATGAAPPTLRTSEQADQEHPEDQNRYPSHGATLTRRSPASGASSYSCRPEGLCGPGGRLVVVGLLLALLGDDRSALVLLLALHFLLVA